MAFFRACCRQSASTLDSPSSKERPSASAIAAMFPNDAAAICPPKMRLTVGMDTPLRQRLYIRNPALDQISTNFLWSECCVFGSWDNPTHLRKILVSRTHHIHVWQPTRRGDQLCKRKHVMIEWIGKRDGDHWLFTSPRAKNIRICQSRRSGQTVIADPHLRSPHQCA